jgi:hypothetical protein
LYLVACIDLLSSWHYQMRYPSSTSLFIEPVGVSILVCILFKRLATAFLPSLYLFNSPLCSFNTKPQNKCRFWHEHCEPYHVTCYISFRKFVTVIYSSIRIFALCCEGFSSSNQLLLFLLILWDTRVIVVQIIVVSSTTVVQVLVLVLVQVLITTPLYLSFHIFYKPFCFSVIFQLLHH